MNPTQKEFKIELRNLVQRFQESPAYYKSPAYDESALRNDFLNPFWSLLGWDLENRAKKPQSIREVQLEALVEIEGRKKRADYTFRVGGINQFVCEAKKPSEPLGKAFAFQVQRYARNLGVWLGVLSNFDQFQVFIIGGKPDRENPFKPYLQWDFTDLPGAAEEVWRLFSRDSVANGALDEFLRGLKKKPLEGTEGWFVPTERAKTFDEEFLEYMEQKRIQLARDLVRHNPGYEWDDTNLNEIVQRILNRILFIRICEDRDIDTGRPLEEILEEWERKSKGRPPLYSMLVAHFQSLDKPFNGTLFKNGDSSEAVMVSDEFLSSLVKELSSDDSDYLFSTIPVEILGSVYERFIGSAVRVIGGNRVHVEPKPGARKAGGVYYTPRYVVDFIVERTVGKLLKGLGPKKVEAIRVLDPACGSGSFLIRAFERICEHYTSWYERNVKRLPRDVCYRDASGSLQLTTHFKRSVMLQNIYGVDLDPQAVEVTMLSLYLKILENESRSTLAQQRALFPRESFLPDLGANVCLGNSLIANDFFDMFADGDERARIRAFDWDVEFKNIIDAGGFHAVIGNPPYYNVDTLGKESEEMRYLMTRYSEIWNDKTDILNYFLYKGIRLSRCYVGMIVSRAFLEAHKSDRLRQAILNRTKINQLVDFGDYHVFKAGISTAIMIMQREATSHTISVRKLKSADEEPDLVAKALMSAERSDVFEEFNANQNHLTSDSWNLAPEPVRDLYGKIDDERQRLDHFLIGGQGMQTGCNEVFGLSRSELRKLTVSSKWARKRARNSDIQRWEILDSGESLLWVEDCESFDDLPEKIQEHLRENATALRKRAAYKRGNCDWWKFTWPLHKELYSQEKIVSPFLSDKNRFALDSEREFVGLTDTIALFKRPATKEDIRYFLGLLNSKLLTFRFRGIAKLKGGGIYEYFENSVSKLPIRQIDFSKRQDTRKHDRIVKLVDSLRSLAPKLRNRTAGFKRQIIERAIRAAEQELDAIVYDLYGLSPSEIRAVGREIPS
jgi:type I restriction-modification system DNA methylase subunit